jgi:hypothetical protein
MTKLVLALLPACVAAVDRHTNAVEAIEVTADGTILPHVRSERSLLQQRGDPAFKHQFQQPHRITKEGDVITIKWGSTPLQEEAVKETQDLVGRISKDFQDKKGENEAEIKQMRSGNAFAEASQMRSARNSALAEVNQTLHSRA